MMYRILCRCDNEIAEWETSNRQTYDSAGKNSSALASALLRNAQAEIAAWIHNKTVAIFNDYETCFDTIDIPTLLVESIFTEFPPIQMSMALQQHLAPRVIQATGFSGEPSLVYKSILAGCRHSVAMTRTLLLRSMKTIVKSTSNTNTKVHAKVDVDDTATLAVDKSGNSVVGSVVQTVF